VTNLWSRLAGDPVGFFRRAVHKLIYGPVRYRGKRGYNAERYWTDRLRDYGSSLKGPGHEGLSDLENKRIYDSSARVLLNALARERLDLQRCRLLEVGCGNGYFTRLCRTHGVVNYVGIDITDTMFDEFRTEFPGYVFEKADVTRATHGAGNNDIVLVIDVLEHITTGEGLDAALSWVRSQLALGGRLFIALPTSNESDSSGLFYLRFWAEADLVARFGELDILHREPFRFGQLYTLSHKTP